MATTGASDVASTIEKVVSALTKNTYTRIASFKYPWCLG